MLVIIWKNDGGPRVSKGSQDPREMLVTLNCPT